MRGLIGRAAFRPLAVLAILAWALLGIASGGLRAQSLDPRTLQALQGALGANAPGVPLTGQNAGTALDAARTAGANTQTPGTNTLPQETPEEIALRRDRARQALITGAPASPLEREYQQRLADTSLRQFGYDLFRAAPTGAPLTGAIGGDYVLGVGDELVVSFLGPTPSTQTVRVDREGRIVVGSLPPIRAAGRPLEAVREDLAASTRRTLLGTSVNVTVGAVRSISVFVGGEVAAPGEYQLTSLGDVAAALAQAGGIRRTGSLRRVRLVRGGSAYEVDLYGLLGIGTPPAIRLREGDRVIVPVIGPTAAIAGGVARPGIYELRGPATVGELLGYAGGAVRPRGERVTISRIEADGSEAFVRGSGPFTRLIAGDAVEVIGGSAGGALGRVLLRGYVLNPGPRPLAAAPTLRDLVGELQDLRPQTYLPMAVIVRTDRETGARTFVPANLAGALSGARPVALASEDRVFILSQSDVDFMNSAAVRDIVLGGNYVPPRRYVQTGSEANGISAQNGNIGQNIQGISGGQFEAVTEPPCRALERLQTLVRDTQGPRYSAIVRGYFNQNGRAASVAGALAQRTVSTAQAAALDQSALLAETTAQAAAAPAPGSLNGAAPDTRRAADIDEDSPNCPRVFQDEPELLPFLIEHAVSVGGAVRKPGAYPIAESADATVLAKLAEGLLFEARGLELDVTRADAGGGVLERVPTGPDGALPVLRLAAGDDIRFNASAAQFEPGGVLLSGEVARPGLYTIRRGEKLSELIARAGGPTSLAYTYGAVFTRRAVREQQQEGLRRTARELNEALLVASVRTSASSTSGQTDFAAASNFIQGISSVDPIGRVVTEVDPRVIALRPDLDTVLEAGDAVFIPKRPSFVLVLGDVGNPGATQFINGKTAAEYVREAGGTRRTSDIARTFVVLPNGATQPLAMSFGRRARFSPPPGSTIIVPVNTTKFLGLSTARDIATIVGQFISSIATVALLAK